MAVAVRRSKNSEGCHCPRRIRRRMNTADQTRQRKTNTMKPFKKLIVTAIIGITLASVYRVAAGDEMLAPRARANQIKTVSGTTPDLLDRSVKGGSPKALEMAASLRKAAGTTADKLDRSYASIPKLREQSGAHEFQVAPLK